MGIFLRSVTLALLVLIAACNVDGATPETPSTSANTGVLTSTTGDEGRPPLLGDDEDLNLLAASCFEGEFGACDSLFLNSASGL